MPALLQGVFDSKGITSGDFEKLASLLTKASYRFARSMPHNPHWYTHKDKWKSKEDFVWCVSTLRRYSYIEEYQGSKYKMFDVNGMKHWTMFASDSATTILNKTFCEAESCYDGVASVYDEFFSDNDSVEEDRRLMELIPSRGSVLDIGCGTGLFARYKKPHVYVGVDPSHRMLEKCRESVGENAALICSPFERFYMPRKFQTIVSLYGSAAYLDPESVKRVPGMLDEGGHYYLMFFKPGFTPRVNDILCQEVSHYPYPDWLGEPIEFGNYLIGTNDQSLS